MPKKPLEFKEGMIVNGRKIVRVLKWKVWYDTRVKLPCGQQFSVNVAAPDEKLPQIYNKPHWIEEREAIFLIFEKKKKE